MNRLVIRIHYSPLLGLPLIKDVFYLLQSFLLKHGGVSFILVSRKNTLLRKKLLSEVFKKDAIVFLSAYQLAYQLREYNGKYVLDLSKKNRRLSSKDLHDLKWAIHFSQSVTYRTRSCYRDLIPHNFPVWRSYAICMRVEVATHCDFVKQTAKQLIEKNIHVLFLSSVEQRHLGNVFKGLYNYVNLSSLANLHTIPYRLRFLLSPLHQYYHKWKIRNLFRALDTRVMWCFDPEDHNYLSLQPKNCTTVYDVVDYLSSENHSLKIELEKSHQLLLRKSTLVVCNSYVLLREVQKKRRDAKLVPQGFDIESFQEQRNENISIGFGKLVQEIIKKRKQSKIVTYIGTLSYRVNYGLLIYSVSRLPKVTFCLPKTVLKWDSEDKEVSWKQNIKILEKLPNVIWYSSLSRSEVSILLKHTDIGIIPYDLRYKLNQYCFPMKFFEYLYAGVKIISTPIEELKRYPSYCVLKNSGEDWVSEILRGNITDGATFTDSKEICKKHSWESKVTMICNYIESTL